MNRIQGIYRRIAVFLCVPMLLLLHGCLAAYDPVLAALPEYTSRAFYTHGDFQDYTDYGKYTYRCTTRNTLEKTGYFQEVTWENREIIQRYVEDFENWLAVLQENSEQDLTGHYDFDFSTIVPGDYFYIRSDENPENGNGESMQIAGDYSVYLFHMETQTLYYLHNND